jgi:hypothetical protein
MTKRSGFSYHSPFHLASNLSDVKNIFNLWNIFTRFDLCRYRSENDWECGDTPSLYILNICETLASEFHLVQSKRLSARSRLGIEVRLFSDTDDTVSLAQIVSVVIAEYYIG